MKYWVGVKGWPYLITYIRACYRTCATDKEDLYTRCRYLVILYKKAGSDKPTYKYAIKHVIAVLEGCLLFIDLYIKHPVQ